LKKHLGFSIIETWLGLIFSLILFGIVGIFIIHLNNQEKAVFERNKTRVELTKELAEIESVLYRIHQGEDLDFPCFGPYMHKTLGALECEVTELPLLAKPLYVISLFYYGGKYHYLDMGPDRAKAIILDGDPVATAIKFDEKFVVRFADEKAEEKDLEI